MKKEIPFVLEAGDDISIKTPDGKMHRAGITEVVYHEGIEICEIQVRLLIDKREENLQRLREFDA